MNRERTSEIYQYALLMAAQEDDTFDRGLGPIHLLKYAYLADLEHAKHNQGRTYTGTEWRFHNFGPWSVDAHQVIADSVAGAGAVEVRRSSNFGDDDYVRWHMLLDGDALQNLKQSIPLAIRGIIEKCVHEFGSDTGKLLHFVYATPPMLKAAPGELLDFSPRAAESGPSSKSSFVPLTERLSFKKRKRLAEKMNELSRSFASSCARQAPATAHVVNERSDESDVIDWVDSLAGPPFPDGEVLVRFTPDTWKSEARSGETLD